MLLMKMERTAPDVISGAGTATGKTGTPLIALSYPANLIWSALIDVP